MQFLNLCANKAFGIIFTWLLGQPVKDTLCGTKALERHRYEQIAAGRSYFGDFDPFGDFDLLLGAARVGAMAKGRAAASRGSHPPRRGTDRHEEGSWRAGRKPAPITRGRSMAISGSSAAPAARFTR